MLNQIGLTRIDSPKVFGKLKKRMIWEMYGEAVPFCDFSLLPSWLLENQLLLEERAWSLA